MLGSRDLRQQSDSSSGSSSTSPTHEADLTVDPEANVTGRRSDKRWGVDDLGVYKKQNYIKNRSRRGAFFFLSFLYGTARSVLHLTVTLATIS